MWPLPAAGARELDTMLDQRRMHLHQSSYELRLYTSGRRTDAVGLRGLPGNPTSHRRFLRSKLPIMLLRKHDLLVCVRVELDLSMTLRR